MRVLACSRAGSTPACWEMPLGSRSSVPELSWWRSVHPLSFIHPPFFGHPAGQNGMVFQSLSPHSALIGWSTSRQRKQCWVLSRNKDVKPPMYLLSCAAAAPLCFVVLPGVPYFKRERWWGWAMNPSKGLMVFGLPACLALSSLSSFLWPVSFHRENWNCLGRDFIQAVTSDQLQKWECAVLCVRGIEKAFLFGSPPPFSFLLWVFVDTLPLLSKRVLWK